MKYLLFAGEHYEHEGGILDYVCQSDSIDELKKKIVSLPNIVEIDWFHIVDKETVKIVCASDDHYACYDLDNLDEIELINLDELKKDHQSR